METLVSLIMLTIISLIATILGRVALKLFRPVNMGFAIKTVFSCGLGLIAISLTTYFIGLAGWLYKSTLIIVLMAATMIPAILDRKSILSVPSRVRSHVRLFLSDLDPLSKLLLTFLGTHAMLNLIGALAPETGFDAMWYHLSIPEIYLTRHRITFLPEINLSGYPRLMEMLFVVGLGLSGEMLAKLMHFSMGIFTSAAIFAGGARYFTTRAGLIAASIFYAMQPINMLSATANIDLGLAFMVTLGLLAMLLAIETGALRLLALSGLFAGAAISTKYTGAFIAVALALTWFIFSKNNLGEKARGAVILTLASILLFSPWAIDNYLSTGNPVYPMFNTIFGLSDNWEQVSLGSVRPGGWFQDHTFIGFITLPFKLMTGGCDGWISPVIIAMIPLAFFVRNKDRFFNIICFFSLVLYLGLFLLPYWLVRFFVPLTPSLALLSGYVLLKAGNEDGWLRKTLTLLLIITLLSNLGFLALKDGPMIKTALGFESSEDYLSKTLGWYKVNGYLKDKLKPGAKVAVYGAQLFYRFDFPYIHDLSLNIHGAEKVEYTLKKMDIEYVLLLVDSTGPQNLWDINGYQNAKSGGHFVLVKETPKPAPSRVNTARGYKLYVVK